MRIPLIERLRHRWKLNRLKRDYFGSDTEKAIKFSTREEAEAMAKRLGIEGLVVERVPREEEHTKA
jgi:hypothetical protein